MTFPSAYSKRPDGTIGTSSLGNIDAGCGFPDPDQTKPDSEPERTQEGIRSSQYGGAKRRRKSDVPDS
jgi:hypothetical protein